MKLQEFTATSIDLTEKCNLRCSYCFRNDLMADRDLTEEMGKRILDWWISKADISQHIEITWWGGEPLLKWELLKTLTKYAENKLKKIGAKDFCFGGTTNGILYTPEKVEWLKQHNALFMVSLDGVEESHNYFRKTANGKGSWKIIDKNIREAKKIARVHIRQTLAPETVHLWFESIKYFVEDLCLDDIAFSPVCESIWSEEKMDILKEQFDLISKYYVQRIKDGNGFKLKHVTDTIDCQPNRTPQNPCGAGRGYSGFGVDGYMWPCHRFNKHGLSFEERENSPLIIAKPSADGINFEEVNLKWRESFETFKDNLPEDCLACEIYDKSICSGSCYATNFDLTGDIKGHTKFICDFAKIQHEHGVKTRERLKKEGLYNLKQNNQQNNQQNCVCYNMCYMEGTQFETMVIDPNTDASCICYNSSYVHTYKLKEQARAIKDVRKQKQMTKKMLSLCKRILTNNDEPKSKKHKEKEIEVIQKTIEIL